jgi:hypothetical protein
MMYYVSKDWTNSVQRSNNQTPFYGSNKRSPKEAAEWDAV